MPVPPARTIAAPTLRPPTTAPPPRRARWPRIAGSLITFGVLSLAAGTVSGQITVTAPSQLIAALAVIHREAPRIGAGLLTAGGAIAVSGISWRLLRRRRRRLQSRVIMTCAAVLHLSANQIRLRRTHWGSGGLRAGLVYYQPPEAVISDFTEQLTVALAPHSSPISIRWQPKQHRFAIAVKPPVTLRLEEKYPHLGKLAESLGHIVGTLTVDQRLSSVEEDGSVQRLVARYNHTTRDIGDGFRQRVQTVLDAKAPSPTGYWTVRWDPAANEVTVEPAQPLPRKADYPITAPDLDQQMLIPLGLGDGGGQVCWKPEVFPHLLVVGPTGSGKTIFLNNLIISCAARNWIVLLVDPKELSFRGFDPRALAGRGWPTWSGVEMVATSEAEMEEAIDFFHRTMRDRYAALKNFQVREADLPPLLLIVDETGELVERLTEYHSSDDKVRDLAERAVAEGRDADQIIKPKGTKNPELRKIWSGLRLGRQGRAFVVTATQRPDVSFIPGEARSNLTTRVGLGHLDGAALEMVFNTRAIQQRVSDYVIDPMTGQRRRQRVRGRATVDVGDGPRTIQTFWVPDPAKVITEELSNDDIALIQALQHLVNTSAERWAGQAEAPTINAEASQTLDPELEAEAGESEWQQPTAEGPDVAGDFHVTYGRRLRIGQTALLEVECVPTLVEIEEIEEDPDNPDDIQITYRVCGDEPQAGELGVTSVGLSEEVLAEP